MKKTLILGIGNILMGDEGVGLHVVKYLQERPDKLPGIDMIDGGTGGFHLLEYFHEYQRVILIDATIDGQPVGAVRLLRPKYSSDYPPTLTAHDIGLKDLLDALYLLEKQPEIILFTVSIEQFDRVTLALSPYVQEAIETAGEEIIRFCRTFDA